MQAKVNYQLLLDNELKKIESNGALPKLLLHSCCAPCSSYVLEYLTKYFDITLYFYNPNITKESEFVYRLEELKRLVESMPKINSVSIEPGEYYPQDFFDAVKGYEKEPERGKRCDICYELRLRKTFEYAMDKGFDYITTTLSISPYKKADKLNEIGEALSKEFNIPYLYSDFKKKNGFKRSIELSEEYNLYRQDYCGCIFSQTNPN